MRFCQIVKYYTHTSTFFLTNNSLHKIAEKRKIYDNRHNNHSNLDDEYEFNPFAGFDVSLFYNFGL